jgi:branched-chain amino acid transport system permease protein
MISPVPYIINGIVLGSIYAMVAVGLTLIFGVLETVNFAHGEFYMLGAYMMWIFCRQMNLPYALSVPASVIVLAFFGLIVERIAVRPFIERDWRFPIISTLGVSIFVQNAVLLTIGSEPRTVSTAFSVSNIKVLGAVVSYQGILVVVVSSLLFLSFHLFVTKTKLGKVIRAVSQNKEACHVVGINVQKIYSITFVIGIGIAGLGGALVGPLFALYPTMGFLLGLKSYAVIIMGGFGNVKGAICAAFILGIAESLFGGYLAYEWKDALSFALLILTLLFKPHGLFGKRVGI